MSALARLRSSFATRAVARGARTYATQAPVRPKRTGRRTVLWSSGLLGTFYAGSAYASTKSDRYADWFSHTVPLGQQIVEFADTHTLDDFLAALQSANRTAQNGYARLKALVAQWTGDEDKDAIVFTPTPPQKVPVASGQNLTTDVRDESVPDVQKQAEELTTQAKDKVEQVAEQATSKAQELHPARPKAEDPTGRVAHNPGPSDRRLTPGSSGTLRSQPSGFPLPSLTSSVGSGPAEGVIKELAQTIESLAEAVASTPAGSRGSTYATAALREAESELAKLTAHINQIQASEEARLHSEVQALRKSFKAQLFDQAEVAIRQAGESEASWQARLEAQSQALHAQAEQKLRTELEQQAAQIHQKMYDEVIAQGVALQKRWTEEIGQRVEAERGGRLAHLEDLAKQVAALQDKAADEAKAQDDAARLRQLLHATQALELVSLTDGGKPFREELQALYDAVSSATAQDKAQILPSLVQYLQRHAAADTGVVSQATLHMWFVDRVAPSLLSVSLVPQEAGPIAHATSALLGPLLSHNAAFTKSNAAAHATAIARTALDRNQLATATAALSQLDGWPRVVAKDWLQAARNRLEVQQAIDTIKAEARYEALLLA